MGERNFMLDFLSYDMDTWMTYLQDNWYVIAISLVVIFIVVKAVKAVVKWLIIILIVLGLIFYSGYTLDDIKQFGSSVVTDGVSELKEIGSKVGDSVKQQAIDSMLKEGQFATYKANGDGTFTVSTESLAISGVVGSTELEVSVKGAPAFKVQTNETIEKFIKQAQNN